MRTPMMVWLLVLALSVAGTLPTRAEEAPPQDETRKKTETGSLNPPEAGKP